MTKNQGTVLDLLDELRAIAQLGLNYTKDPYDLQRYDRILNLASMEYAQFTGIASPEIKARFNKELGYITPKVGVQCALFSESGEILLERRKDDLLWGLPSGWVEVGETPEEAIQREILEEANLVTDAIKLVGFYTRLPGQYDQPHSSIHLLYLCKRWHGELKISFESLVMEFCDPRKISDWHKDHKQQVEDVMTNFLIP